MRPLFSHRQQLWIAIGVAVAGVVIVAAARGAEAKPPPRPKVPTGEELQRAEKLLQDAFADEIAAAKTPEQKIALARKIWQTTTRDAPDNRWAALCASRDLATEAGVAMEALGFAAQLGSFDDGNTSLESLKLGRAAWGKRKPTLADGTAAMEHFKRATRADSKLVASEATRAMREIQVKVDPKFLEFEAGLKQTREEIRKQIEKNPPQKRPAR